jgi:2,4-dienoyl-CoA reductase-like NADH-dependent reductase (Old Yellow Enzyme family)
MSVSSPSTAYARPIIIARGRQDHLAKTRRGTERHVMGMRLFDPLDLRGLTLKHRIVVEPMTQFSAEDGVAADWHLMHLGQSAVSGAAMVLSESCYVEAIAGNHPDCLSIYTDEQEAAAARICRFYERHGAGAAFGLQLCHGLR